MDRDSESRRNEERDDAKIDRLVLCIILERHPV